MAKFYSKYGSQKARNLLITYASALVAPNFTGNRDLSRKFGRGKVKDDFEQAVLRREQTHPTGLPSGKIAVAIPHTDVQYVKEAGIRNCFP